MGTQATAEPVVFDPYDYGFQEDPYPVYAHLREHDPLHHNEEQDFWVLTRHADVAAALRDDRTFSSRMGVSLDASAWNPQAHRVMSFIAMDPPEHQRLRSLVSRGFTPRRVRELAPRIQELTGQYLDRLLAGAPGDTVSLDWIRDFAGKLPMDVISEMMGVPEPDRDEVRRLADLVVHREPGNRDVPEAGMAASLELVTYYAELARERRANPTDDLTSALIQTDLDGDQLSEEEIIAFLFLMVVAGNETTTKLLGHALYHLAAHPAQQAEVFAGPHVDDHLLGRWIEETLRYDTSSQHIARHVVQPFTLHGRTVPADSKMLVSLGSANRDERVFTHPDVYDLHRDKDELSQLISFGGGRHFCLGAHLARLEARIALGELVRRVRTYAVDTVRTDRVHSSNVRGFSSEPIEVVLR